MATPVYDPLLDEVVMHDHTVDLDSRYVNVDGDTMIGDLVFPVTGYLMVDSNGVYWRVTIGIDGELITSSETYIPNAIITELGEYLLTEAGEYLIQE